jgi:plastocyanin
MFSTPKFATFAAISCLSLAVIPIVRSAVIEVTVGGVGVIAYTPNQVQANIGDVIQFTFKQKNHTITRSTLAKYAISRRSIQTVHTYN